MSVKELQIDRDQIEIFIDAIFRNAPRGFIWLRSFHDDKTQKPYILRPVLFDGNYHTMVDAGCLMAQQCADAMVPVVFALPDAVFKTGRNAAEANILACRSLTVDCDKWPRRGRTTLETLLEPATITVFTGGIFKDPDTGECEPKWHLRWRLNAWADGASLNDLKEARQLAAKIATADTSGASLVHPFRCPGSWHRKSIEHPQACHIDTETLQPDREIDLGETLSILRSEWEKIRPPEQKRAWSQPIGEATPHLVATRFCGILGHLLKAADGQRNTSLFWCANRVVDWFASGDIDANLAEHFMDTLREGASRCGLGEPEIAKTIASSMKRLG